MIPDWTACMEEMKAADEAGDYPRFVACLRSWYCEPRENDAKFLRDLRAKIATMFDREVDVQEITHMWDQAWDRENAELEEKHSELQLQQSAFRKKKVRAQERYDTKNNAYKHRMFELTTRMCSNSPCNNLVFATDLYGMRDTVIGCDICKAIAFSLTQRDDDYFEWMSLYCSSECQDAHELQHQRDEHACGAREKCTTQPRPLITSKTVPIGTHCTFCWEDYQKPTFFCNTQCQTAAQDTHGQRVTSAHDQIQAQAFHEMDQEKPPPRKSIMNFRRWLESWMTEEELKAYNPKLERLAKGIPWTELDEP